MLGEGSLFMAARARDASERSLDDPDDDWLPELSRAAMKREPSPSICGLS